MSVEFITMRGDGVKIDPCTGIVPILKDKGKGLYSVIGTGFYITRYGLVMTASHVLGELMDGSGKVRHRGIIPHVHDNGVIYPRPIRVIHRFTSADLAIAHADNYYDKVPDKPLINLFATLSTIVPKVGERLVTYAYPENEILDFKDKSKIPTIIGDYFAGKFLRLVKEDGHPNMPLPYFETSIEVRSGASGGPVFDSQGRIVAVNCSGFDFRGTEEECFPLSFPVPIGHCLNRSISHLPLTDSSWEMKQLPKSHKDNSITIRELAMQGHLHFDPPLK